LQPQRPFSFALEILQIDAGRHQSQQDCATFGAAFMLRQAQHERD
jgi:hypothetical protein